MIMELDLEPVIDTLKYSDIIETGEECLCDFVEAFLFGQIRPSRQNREKQK